MSFESINILMMLVGLALFLFFSLPINACLGHTRKPAFILGLYLISYAEIVLITEAAGLINALNLRTCLLLGVIMDSIAVHVWFLRGRPALLGPFVDVRWKLPSLRDNSPLWLLVAGVAALLLMNAFLIVATPPNTYDSMTYHLSRVGYWIQHRSLHPWLTPNIRQNVFPINAEVGLLWTVLLSGSERLTGFVQWISSFACFLSIVGMARLFGASVPKSLFAGLIPLTFPLIFLQSGTTQNDLAAASFVASSLYLFYLGIRQCRNGPLWLSSLAIGLAIGTKTTVLIALPGFVLAVFILSIQGIRNHWIYLFRWGLACIISFVLLGGLVYFQNFRSYGDPLGIGGNATNVVLQRASSWRGHQLLNGLLLSGYQWVDLSGLPKSMVTAVNNIKAQTTNRFFIRMNQLFWPNESAGVLEFSEILWYPELTEDTSWFGILGAILMFAAFAITLSRSIHLRQLDLLAPLIFTLTFWLVEYYMSTWTPYQGRYFVLPVIVLAPSMAWLYPEKPGWNLFNIILVLFGLTIGTMTLLNNTSRPLVGPRAIWNLNEQELRTIRITDQLGVIQAIQDHVPDNAVLTTRLGEDDWDYPLFGSKFKRVVIPLDPGEKPFDIAEVTQHGADFFLVSTSGRNFLHIPYGLQLLERIPNGWLLFMVTNEPATPVSDADQEYLLGSEDATGLFQVSERLVGRIGLTKIQTPVLWGIENTTDGPLLWLGHGDNGSLRLRLWSENSEDVPVELTLHLIPGPSRTDPRRTVTIQHGIFGISTSARILAENSIFFDKESAIKAPLVIIPGANQIMISIEEAPTLVSINGDVRSLMAMLRSVRISPIEK